MYQKLLHKSFTACTLKIVVQPRKLYISICKHHFVTIKYLSITDKVSKYHKSY